LAFELALVSYYSVLAHTGRGSWQPRDDAHLWLTFNLRAHHMQAQTVARRVEEADATWIELDQLVSEHDLPERVIDAMFDAVLGAPRVRDTDGHIPRGWFRNQIWRPALAEAGVTVVRPHDLRHAHASWLLAGGADLQAVKERLGHASIATTEKYLHTLPDADDSTLDAFTRIRDRSAAARA
jgi:integrase